MGSVACLLRVLYKPSNSRDSIYIHFDFPLSKFTRDENNRFNRLCELEKRSGGPLRSDENRWSIRCYFRRRLLGEANGFYKQAMAYKNSEVKARLSCFSSSDLNQRLEERNLMTNPVELSGKGQPQVFHDIALALKKINTCIFSAEIGRHLTGDREWEVYNVLINEEDSLPVSRRKIDEQVWSTLMAGSEALRNSGPLADLQTHSRRVYDCKIVN